MKKLIALLLALVFCWQAVPQNVLADMINTLPTAEEMAAAVATTGLAEGAAVYHEGMPISKSMTATQMKGWIEEYQNRKLAYIMDTFENYDVELSYVKEQYPVTYEMLKGFSEAGIGLLYDNYSKAMDLRDEVAYYHNMLAQAASRTYTLIQVVQDEEPDDRMKVIYAYQIRDSWKTMNSLMGTVLDLSAGWESEYDRLEHLLTAPGATGSTETLSWLLDQVDSLRSTTGRATLKSMTVSASSLRVRQDQSPLTRLARLSPISSALADSDQQMHVMVMDDKHIYLGVTDESGVFPGAEITVQESGKAAVTETTDDTGYAAFPVRDIPTDDDGEAQVNLSIKADGYRDIEASQVWITKGENTKIPAEKDDGTTYIKAWSFAGKDITLADLEVKLSPYNDEKQKIAVKISGSSHYFIYLYFVDKNGKEAMEVGSGSGGIGEKEFTFSGQYLSKLSAGSRLEAQITVNGETQVYQSKLVMTKSDIDKPIGGPDLMKVIEPGFSFTTPKDWPGPFDGATIKISLPIEKYWPIRVAIDVRGSGILSLGTTAFDDFTQKTKDNWKKTPDTRTLAKKTKEAEKKGYEERALAQTGASWEGERKHSYMILGGFSFSSSMFGFAAVQVRRASDDYGQVLAKGGAGLTASVSADFGIDWGAAALGIYAKAAFTIFPEVGVKWNCYVPDFLSTLTEGAYGFGALNVKIRLDLGVTARAGIKGAACISVKGYGFLEFVFRLAADLSDEEKPVDLTIYGGFGVKVIVEYLWVATYEYMPFGKDWKWRLYPGPVEQAKMPQTPVQRFIAFLLASADAEDAAEEEEGGGQIHLNNEDLVLHPEEVGMKAGYGGVGKASRNRLFSMRASGSGSATVPMTLYTDESYSGPEGTFNRPILVSHALSDNNQPAVPLLTRNSDGSDAFMPGDGYEVIDYDFWVADVSGTKAYTYSQGSTGVLLTDVLFTVAILAKDYEQQEVIQEDFTTETYTVPSVTYTYVRVWWLREQKGVYRLEPVVLTKGGTYLAESIDTASADKNYTHPGSNPRIFGDIVFTQGKKFMTMYRIVTRSLNQTDLNYHSKRPCAIYSYVEENGYAEKWIEDLEKTDDFFEKQTFEDLIFYDIRDNTEPVRYSSAKVVVGRSTIYFTLVHDEKFDSVLYSLGHDHGFSRGTKVYANNVFSIASRNVNLGDEYRRMIFMVQPQENGDHYGLMGLLPTSTNKNMFWTTYDYDVVVPPTDLYWTTLYGQECVYWLETAGTDEDSGGNLFRVRGVWYDASNNTVSEPFVLATICTDSEDSVPTNVVLAGNNSGFFIVNNPNGNRICRFNFQLVVGLRLVGNVLSSTLAEPGTYDDLVLTVYNDGNVPLSGLDLLAYDQFGSDEPKAFESIHLDVVEPAKNRITLQKGLEGVKEQKSGETVARQIRSSFNEEDSQLWLITSRHYQGRISNVVEETQQLMQTNLIMPGTFAAFNISLLLPQNWEGGAHHIYLEVETLFTEAQGNFSNVARLPGDSAANGSEAASAPRSVIAIHRNGSLTRTVDGVVSNATRDDLAMYKTDVTFESIQLDTDPMDLEIHARRWDDHGTPMVNVILTNAGHLAKASRSANSVVLEAFLDDEETPVFRYSLPEDVSDKETWSLEMPLSLLTDGRSAYKVTLEVTGKDYTERTLLSNRDVIYLDTASLMVITQPEDQTVPEGSEAVFSVGVSGGVGPYQYQWQVKTPGGSWVDITGATGSSLTLRGVTLDMTGNLYRCVITDALGDSVTSSSAKLTVTRVPKTGDDAPLLWWLLGILLSLAGFVFVLRGRKRGDRQCGGLNG